jgi:hypothetical protein
MNHFLSSPWFGFIAALILAIITTATYALMPPTGLDISNGRMIHIFQLVGWGSGALIGVIVLITIGILNLLRRLVKIRKVSWLHPIIILLALMPWLIFSWELTGEPRYTNIARAVIDFIARPLLWGTLVAIGFTILTSILGLIFSKK